MNKTFQFSILDPVAGTTIIALYITLKRSFVAKSFRSYVKHINNCKTAFVIIFAGVTGCKSREPKFHIRALGKGSKKKT